MHFKHEQSQVLSLTNYKTQPTCIEYIDTIVGMTNGHIDIHGNSLEDPGVCNTDSE